MFWCFISTALVLASAPGELEAQAAARAATIVGLVLDDFDNPVPNADVVLTEARQTLPVNRLGRFTFSGNVSGRHTVMVRAIGYKVAFVRVDVPAGDTGWVLVRMRMLPQRLAPVETTATPDEAELLPDFERRRRAGFGYFITQEDIAAARPITVSQFLRRFPTVRVMDSMGVPQALSSRGPKITVFGQAMIVVPCVMRVAVDGQMLPAGTSLDFASPSQLAGIEIYPGPSTLPVEFAALAKDAACGLIVFWTRRQ